MLFSEKKCLSLRLIVILYSLGHYEISDSTRVFRNLVVVRSPARFDRPFEKAYKRTYNIRKVSGVKPTIDGKLDEDFWTKQGEWSDRFVQIIPYERAITQSPTRVKLFYDDKYIYVGVYCKDAVPDKMNRFIGNRDDNSLGDLISVAFDTYHDYRAAPEFNINLEEIRRIWSYGC